MNGNERLYWAEDQHGYAYLMQPGSPLKPGFIMHSTVMPCEMDRVFGKIDKQEKKRYADMTESIFLKQREWIDQNRKNLRLRMEETQNPKEKEFIAVWLKAFDNKMDKLLKNTVYGVAEMQRMEAPVPAENKFITAEEIRSNKAVQREGYVNLRSVKPKTEVVQ